MPHINPISAAQFKGRAIDLAAKGMPLAEYADAERNLMLEVLRSWGLGDGAEKLETAMIKARLGD